MHLSHQDASTCENNPAEGSLTHRTDYRAASSVSSDTHPHTRSATRNRVTHQYAWYRIPGGCSVAPTRLKNGRGAGRTASPHAAADEAPPPPWRR